LRQVFSGVLVMALKVALGVSVLGCTMASSRTPLDRHVLPKGLSQVALEDFDLVSFLDVDLHTAVQTREAVESEFVVAYGRTGHPRWFFHAFDDKNLEFVVARLAPGDPSKPRYVAERRLRIRRSRDAERALGVTNVVLDYENSPRGIKPGMSRREVTKAAGRPRATLARGPKSFDLVYASSCVRIVDERVQYLWRCDL
jgi:hypothetical protein